MNKYIILYYIYKYAIKRLLKKPHKDKNHPRTSLHDGTDSQHRTTNKKKLKTTTQTLKKLLGRDRKRPETIPNNFNFNFNKLHTFEVGAYVGTFRGLFFFVPPGPLFLIIRPSGEQHFSSTTRLELSQADQRLKNWFVSHCDVLVSRLKDILTFLIILH